LAHLPSNETIDPGIDGRSGLEDGSQSLSKNQIRNWKQELEGVHLHRDETGNE
jgi:hypothetical protein